MPMNDKLSISSDCTDSTLVQVMAQYQAIAWANVH